MTDGPRPPPAIDVLLVAPTLDFSAPTLYALTLARGLAARGRRVRIIAPGGRLEPAFRGDGVALELHPFLDRFIVDWFLLRKLVRDLSREGVGVVHAVSTLKVATASALGRKLGAPVVATVHRLFDPASGIETDWSRVSEIITFSEVLRVDAVNRRRAPKEKVRVIPAGIAPPPSHPPPFARPGAIPVVGTLGDVEKPEALVDFISAASVVLGRAKDVEMLVVSGGAEPRSLRALARDLGIARSVTFTTFVETQKSLGLMDVCVLPGTEEGPAQAILEAMGAGRPVITSGAGGVYAVIDDGETGLLVEKADRSPAPGLTPVERAARRGGHLAAAILRLVENPELARRLGAQARERALERFPLARMLDETLAVYEDALREAVDSRAR